MYCLWYSKLWEHVRLIHTALFLFVCSQAFFRNVMSGFLMTFRVPGFSQKHTHMIQTQYCVYYICILYICNIHIYDQMLKQYNKMNTIANQNYITFQLRRCPRVRYREKERIWCMMYYDVWCMIDYMIFMFLCLIRMYLNCRDKLCYRNWSRRTTTKQTINPLINQSMVQ